jgi:ATP-dependent RNA helicase DDX51/DBP6
VSDHQVEQAAEEANGDAGEQQRYILPSSLQQSFVVCDNVTQKPLYVLLLIYKYQLTSTLCFVNAVDAAQRLHDLIQTFVTAFPVHRDRAYTVAHYSSTLSPAQRSSMLLKFKRKEVDLLICTDALSRGVDLMTNNGDDMSANVILNYDVPASMKTYVHRVGRTARAGCRGDAITIVSAHEARYWKSMIRKHGVWSQMQRLTDSEMQHATTYGPMQWSFEDVFQKYEAVLTQLRQDRGR